VGFRAKIVRRSVFLWLHRPARHCPQCYRKLHRPHCSILSHCSLNVITQANVFWKYRNVLSSKAVGLGRWYQLFRWELLPSPPLSWRHWCRFTPTTSHLRRHTTLTYTSWCVITPTISCFLLNIIIELLAQAIFERNLFPYKYHNILQHQSFSYLPAYEDGTDRVFRNVGI